MTSRRLWLLACLALAACGADPASPPVGTPDAAAVPDAQPGPDMAPDMAPDIAPDIAPPPDAVDALDVSEVADVGDDIEDASPSGPWRSALYPEDWTPAHTDAQGRFLHDFSYAGYRYGEVTPAAPADALVFDVVEHGADPTGASDATASTQAAIAAAAAAGGGVVWFPPGLYRYDGLLTVKASQVVLRGAGPAESRLWFTTWEGLSYQSHLTFQGDPAHDVELPLAADGASRGLDLELEDASALAPGDDVVLGWVITEDFIDRHGMTGTWQAFNGTWQPFVWRTVLAVDTAVTPHRVTLDVPLRSPALVSDGATLRRVAGGTLRECGVESLGFANAVGWEDAWTQDQVHALELDGVVDSWVRDVASFPSPGAPAEGFGAGEHLQSGGLVVRLSKRVTVTDSTFEHPQHQGGGGNGYLFEVRQSSEILFRDCVGAWGRHNFIQNWGFGATGVIWLRPTTLGGQTQFSELLPDGAVGSSEYHHSLATANLVDAAVVEDGWAAINRQDWSTGAGHTATECVFWAATGGGQVRSRQLGWGYVIGTGPEITVLTSPDVSSGEGTEPEDWREGEGLAATLEPPSLYEDQLARRLVRRPLSTP